MFNSRERSVIAELNEAYLERTGGNPPEKKQKFGLFFGR